MSKLWYRHWADSWNEALPLGNARLGGMVFSNPFCDRIQMNEETLWTGCPHKRPKEADRQKLSGIRRLLFDREYDVADAKISEFMEGNQSEGYVSLGNLYIEHNDVISTKT